MVNLTALKMNFEHCITLISHFTYFLSYLFT